jgi:hypothetical protein
MEINLAKVEDKFPGAIRAFLLVSLLERTVFSVEEDGCLYAETMSGCRYTWSSEEGAWFDS